MTNPPDRVWVTIDRSGHPQYAAPYSGAANEHINDAIDRHVPGAGGWIIREYRLHRPINWRTGVPDAETRRRHGGLFALLLGDGSTLRECYSRPDGKWRWNGSGTGARIINPHVAEVLWCPEGEMPEGGA